jgi:hypothetical protein
MSKIRGILSQLIVTYQSNAKDRLTLPPITIEEAEQQIAALTAEAEVKARVDAYDDIASKGGSGPLVRNYAFDRAEALKSQLIQNGDKEIKASRLDAEGGE